MKNYLLLFGLVISFNYSFSQQNNIQEDFSQNTKDTNIYTMLPTMPQFGKDEEDLQKYIVKKSKYPASKKRTSTTKSVFVEIIIEKNGKVSFEKIARGYNEKLDAEAKRIIEKMPNWAPGRVTNGTAVRFKYTIPIWFE